jgi:hypothetical protein
MRKKGLIIVLGFVMFVVVACCANADELELTDENVEATIAGAINNLVEKADKGVRDFAAATGIAAGEAWPHAVAYVGAKRTTNLWMGIVVCVTTLPLFIFGWRLVRPYHETGHDKHKNYEEISHVMGWVFLALFGFFFVLGAVRTVTVYAPEYAVYKAAPAAATADYMVDRAKKEGNSIF